MDLTDDIRADRARVDFALKVGGYARLTLRSITTGNHLTLSFSAKRRRPDGYGYVSRRYIDGRVGLPDADVVFIDDIHGDPIARFMPKDGTFEPARGAHKNALWAARRVLAWIGGSYDLDAQAEVYIASECCVCHRQLTDPESIERGIGPECYGQRTRSHHAEIARGA